MLTSKHLKKVDLPHEPGEWIEVKMPSVGDLRAVDMTNSIQSTLDALCSCIKAWSYDEDVTPENIADLDPPTITFLETVLFPPQTEAERKND
jgi:hypothetical protein